jgi:hypothetical protein
MGNCGSPIETEQGWLVLTHGVGPMRTYRIGALLLDLDHPERILADLPDPILEANDDERNGYVPERRLLAAVPCGTATTWSCRTARPTRAPGSPRSRSRSCSRSWTRTGVSPASGRARPGRPQVAVDHPVDREVLLDVRPAVRAGQLAQPPDRLHRLVRGRRRRSPVRPVGDHLGTDPSRVAITGVPQAIASTMDSPNGSAKLTRWSSASASPSTRSRSSAATGPEVADAVVVQVRPDAGVEVLLVLHDAGQHQRPVAAAGHLDRLRGPLVRVDPAEEDQCAVRAAGPDRHVLHGMPWCTVAAYVRSGCRSASLMAT